MSFGVSFGDLVLASKLAWTVYKACKDSGESFQRLSGEVASLHVVLKETEDYLDEFPDLDTSRVNRLQILTSGCHGTLKDLEKLMRSYDGLGTQVQVRARHPTSSLSYLLFRCYSLSYISFVISLWASWMLNSDHRWQI
jgi:hypothetical protein